MQSSCHSESLPAVSLTTYTQQQKDISFPRSFNGNPSKQKRILEKCWSNLKYFSVYFMYIFSSKLLVTLSIVILIWHERLFYVGLPLKEIRPYSVFVGILFRYRIMMSAAWMLCLSPVTNNRWTVEKNWCDKKNKKKYCISRNGKSTDILYSGKSWSMIQ